MEVLMILTYVAICYGAFKLFRIPVNGYTLATAALGGVFLLGFSLIAMNYNHPFTSEARFYFYTTPIVPRVRGQVIEVAVKPHQKVEAGDVLFKLDPTPYQHVVEQKKALLAEASQDTRELQSDLSAALAEVRAKAAERDRAKQAYDRLRQANIAAGGMAAVPELQVENSRNSYLAAQAQYESAVQIAERTRLEADSEIGGRNPAVARIWGELQNALYDLEATVVRAPTDGRVLQLMLRPGMMAVPLPLRPVMVFRHDEDPVFVGAFLQGAAQRVIPGAHAEVILDAVPGKVFAARVGYTVDGMAQGQLQPTGELIDPERFIQPGRFAAVIEFEQDLSGYNLPGGASGQVAVYTEHFHHVAMIRKMLLRSKSWLNFLFSDGH